MKISEMMEKNYSKIIEIMKQAYSEALHMPWVIYKVDMDIEDGTVTSHQFVDNNSWYQGWHTIWTFDYRNENPIEIAENNWSGEIYWDEFAPYLDTDGQRMCEEYLDNGHNYSELLDYIKEKFEYSYDLYKKKLIKEIIDSTEEDFFTDILDYVIRDAQEYEDADWED